MIYKIFMAETLTIPPALYDFVLYYECAAKDWKRGSNKAAITGDGGLRDMINWDSTYSFDPDDAGGKTLFGVTESAWQSYVAAYPNKGYNRDLNTMGYNGWHDEIAWFWDTYSHAGKSAHYSCAFIMFQMSWGGFNTNALDRMLESLKTNADIADYPFVTSGSRYVKIADATHAYTNPMLAYDQMRRSLAQYYYNISTPDKTNRKFRNGWLTRSALSFTPYGLYIPTTVSYQTAGLKYESTLEEWEAAAKQLAENNTRGYVKIIDWGTTPEAIEQMASNSFDYTPYSGSSSSGGSSSGSYGGLGGVYQLGDYSNAPDMQIVHRQAQSREEVLNTLVGGSYTPESVSKCVELITSDKKKNEPQTTGDK